MKVLDKSPLVIFLLVIAVIASSIAVRLAMILNMTESAYSDLLSEFNDLSRKYPNLLERCDRLEGEKNDLLEQYNELAERYSWLDLPLETRRVPTINELRLWLRDDETDKYEYDYPDFICFHFTILLMLHGRAQHYDIGVVAIYGYDDETGDAFSHSVNAVMSSQGLVYIEPQLDEVWWVEENLEITNGTTHIFPIADNLIYVEEIEVLFDF